MLIRSMKKKNFMSRRIFCVSFLSASAAGAANPLIDFTGDVTPIISGNSKQSIFAPTYGKFVDLEPKIKGSINEVYTPYVVPQLSSRHLTLELKNVHTDEEINFVIPKSLAVSSAAISKFDHICRDWRYNQIKKMDRQLLSILAKICEESVDEEKPICVEILSGFRTPKTNEMLRRQSNLVAKNSYHKIGKALDFRLPGINRKKVKASAKLYAYGGLGVYKNFIHIDTGPQRRWFM